MDNLEPLDIEFLINNAQLKEDAATAQTTLTSVSDGMQAEAKAASDAIQTMSATSREGLKLQMQQYQALADLTPTSNIARLNQYNQLVEQTKAEIDRLGNAGKTGFDEMGNAIDQSVPKVGKFEAAITRVTDANNIGARVVTGFSRQIISLGVGLLSGIIGEKAIEMLVTYISNLDIFKTKLTDAALKQQDMNAALASADFTGAIDKIESLATDIDLAKKGFIDKTKVLHEYNNELGSSIGYANNLDQAEANIVKHGEAYIQMSLLKAAANIALQESSKKAYEAAVNARKPLDDYENKASDITKTNVDGSGFDGDDLDDEQKKIDADRAARRKKDTDDLLAEKKKQLDIFHDFRTQAAKIAHDNNLDLLDGTGDDKTDKTKKAPTDDNANELLAAQTSLQEKTQALKAEYQTKDKTRDQQEIEAVKAKYTTLYNEAVAQNAKYIDLVKKRGQAYIDAYNASHDKAHQLGLVDTSTVKVGSPDEKAAEAGVRGKQGLEQAKNQIEQEKTLFADYEAFKLKAGTEAANQLYGNQLKGFTSFIDYLKSLAPTEAELNSPDAAVKARANALKDYLKTVLPAADTVLQSQTIKQLEQYIADTQSFEDKSKAIIAKTNDEIAALTLAQSNTTDQVIKDSYEHRIELTKTQGEAEVDQLVNQQQETIDSYKGLAASIETLTTEQANLRIKEAKATAAADYASGKISAAAYKEIIGLIEQAGAAIKANSIAGAFGELATVMEQLSQASAGLDKNLTSTLNTLGSLFKQVETLTTDIPKLAAALKNYQQTKSDAGGGFLGTVSAVASVIPVAGAIISAGVAVVSGVINFFKAAHASAVAAAAQILAYQNSLITGQIQYNELLRDQERTQTDISKLSLQQLQTQEQTLALQTQQAQADYNTLLQQIQATGQQVTGEHTTKYGGFLGIGQKTKVVQDLAGLSDADYDTLEKLYTEGKLTDTTKAWFEQLQTVKGELDDIGTSAQDAVDQINQIATGTTANDIAQSIVQGFEAGKRTAADFANDFQSLMQNAAVSVFESNYLSGKIATFYQQFADASGAPGGLTADAIAKLKEEYAQVITDAGTQFGNLEKVVGVISGSQANSPTLTGEITSSLTEDTGSKIAGSLNGIQLAMYTLSAKTDTNGQTMQDQLTEMRTQTLLQMQIAANTKRSADNSDTMVGSLKNIDNNTSSANLTNLLRAAGH